VNRSNSTSLHYACRPVSACVKDRCEASASEIQWPDAEYRRRGM
jgi:hypothetical protein